MSDTLSFGSRVAAEAFNVPGDVAMIAVRHGGMFCFYKRNSGSTALQTNDGQNWGPASQTAYLQHWGIVPTSYSGRGSAPDATSVMQAVAANWDGEILLTGFVNLTASISVAKAFKMRGIVHRRNCGFWLTTDFPTGVDGVFACSNGEPGPVFENFTIWGDHGDATSYNTLHDYPPAIEASETSRGYIDNVRFVGMRTGMYMVDPVPNTGNNPGGWYIGKIESSCYDVTVDISEAQDFVKIDNIHNWQFGLTEPGQVVSAYYRGDAIALRAHNCDNLNVDTVATYRAKVIVGVDGGGEHSLPVMIGNLALDGDDAGFHGYSGSTLIANLYSTTGTAGADFDIRVKGGDHTIANARVTSMKPDGVAVTGGSLTISGGKITAGAYAGGLPTQDGSGLRVVVCSGGILSMDNVLTNWTNAGGTSDRTRELIGQDNGGVLKVSRLVAPDTYSSGEIVRFRTDAVGNAAFLRDLPAGAVIGVDSYTNGTFETGDEVAFLQTVNFGKPTEDGSHGSPGTTLRSDGGVLMTRDSSVPLQVTRMGNAGNLVTWRNGSTVVGSITTNGTSTSYNETSDYRLKENVSPAIGAADMVMKMAPMSFNFIGTDQDRVGFIAHELDEVLPFAVTGEKDAVDAEGNIDPQCVDYSKLVPVLTAALKEALERIAALEAARPE
ncbi:tail fiber domain-containing protein [Salipiger abyssi]|uniref:tail fiber domain-containing protein n=1 Tax=Salipiger abyssi TaxID=1250539 RepID=UPI004058406F